MNQNWDHSLSQHGHDYSKYRQVDPCIAEAITTALGDTKTVLNVGAGTGAYEPTDRYVVAVEPSEGMRAQRLPTAVPAINAVAEALPFDDEMFDASMALLTIHHWNDVPQGLQEIRRVTRGPVIVLALDAQADTEFWLMDYVPELAAIEQERHPNIEDILEYIGGDCDISVLSVQKDSPGGFPEAYYARPEAFLDARVREYQSFWKCLPAGVEERVVRELANDLKSGNWEKRYGKLREKSSITSQLRLITGHAKAEFEV